MSADDRWIAGVEDAARAVLPSAVSTFIAAGARQQVTAGEAERAWRRWRLVPRVLNDVSAVNTATTLLGQDFATPIGVAPTSMQRAVDSEGELAMARAASSCGAPHVVSSNAGFPFEQIGQVGPWWLQLYLPHERELIRPLLDRAQESGAQAVVLTVDTPVPGPKYAVDDHDWVDIDTSWFRSNLPAELRAPWASDLTPADLEWLSGVLEVPLVTKGVLSAQDAHRCVGAGAAAVWVSNHGGRQLDRAWPTAAALPGVIEAVGELAEVYVDGGIRSGADALTALALGARAVFVGRPTLWALAAAGEGGVSRLLTGLTRQLGEDMRLAGVADVAHCREVAAHTHGCD